MVDSDLSSPGVERSDGIGSLRRSEVTFAVMPLLRAQLVGGVAFLGLTVAGVAPYLLLWGSPAESDGPGGLLILAGVFGGIVVHEALHGVGYVWGGATHSDVKYGVDWSSLTPYAHCAAPLRCGAYRWAIALPGLALGAGPLLVGLVISSWATVFLAALMLGCAGGDALLLWMLRGVPSDAWVRDHPSKMGSLVLGRASSEVSPALAFDLDESDPADGEDTGGGDNSLRGWGLFKAVLFYGVFVLGPYVLYEWIQEDLRPDTQAESLRDLYAVAPNGLGAISTTALLATMIAGIGQMARAGELREFWRLHISELTRLRIAAMSAGGAITGLFAYEIGQIFLPIGTFDVHDMIWTLPGALIGFLAVLAFGSTLPSKGDDRIEDRGR